ncbi:MAG: hypothetical protein IIA44_09470, partial [Acidobacteria bacterium]|nr:hypothetical protein [Acidobacteriota bacterium]
MRIAAVLVALVLIAAACSDGSNAQQSAPLAPATAEPSDADGDRTGIEAFQIDGIWVFQHRSEAAMDALHSGTPEIVNGCLVVDATIVVWHIDGIDVGHHHERGKGSVSANPGDEASAAGGRFENLDILNSAGSQVVLHPSNQGKFVSRMAAVRIVERVESDQALQQRYLIVSLRLRNKFRPMGRWGMADRRRTGARENENQP